MAANLHEDSGTIDFVFSIARMANNAGVFEIHQPQPLGENLTMNTGLRCQRNPEGAMA
ncbi:hypothetical protein Spb1_15690 [Planctopirus ephydatiae]|uniref:Uncharacterized protein n=1 Tax=Planctopirus ephydatiae TaxID=2528019 RepID=A0A518GM70_9PLAN|nr:hypothetical protein Spb1_15690 [Planctopirus ephydatiae]